MFINKLRSSQANSDKVKINTILTSMGEGILKESDVIAIDDVYDVFATEKDYWDAVVNIVLPLRNATNTSYRAFYRLAKENNIFYTIEKVTKSDLFIMGGSNV